MTPTTRMYVTVSAAAISCTIIYFHFRRRVKKLEDEIEHLRLSRVEKKAASTTQEESLFTMNEIGRLHSPFPQRAGCPRQGGILAPHIRSRIIFHSNEISREMLDGITHYSHVWIIFAFHLNPRGKASSGRQGQVKFKGTKVRPPRACGVRVGVLATRAPHRPNPVGLSLGLIERVETITIEGSKRVCLVIRGLDLVDNTPIYDVKPYVPWDRVNSLDIHSYHSSDSSLHSRMDNVVVPNWVLEDDQLPAVNWSEEAILSLNDLALELRPLYDDMDDAKLAISEIIAQDPRALHDGRGLSSEKIFTFSFCSLRISFLVAKASALVTMVSVDEGDLGAVPGSYPHNLALRRQAERVAMNQGSTLKWKCRVREGIADDLFDLKDGGRFHNAVE